jgi:lipoprotein-releasing system permease protein
LNFPLYIAKRYLKTNSKNNAINIISRIASLGVVVGAMALFIVLSVFTGLKDFSLSFSNDFDPDLKIFPNSGKSFLINPDQETKIKALKNIAFYSKTIDENVLFTYNSKEVVTGLKGVDNQYTKVNNVIKTLSDKQSSWLETKTPQVVLGNGIANKLSLGLFDINKTLEVYVPKPGKGAIENPENAFNKTTLIPISIYSISDDLDSKYVFTDLQLAQELLEYKPNQISNLEIKLKAKRQEKTTITDLNKIFQNKTNIKNRAQLNDSLYKMLNTENIIVYLIFTLVIIVTLFTLAGAIIMIIIDKKQNLKTLFNLGVETSDLRKIFLLQGLLITFWGGLLGLFLGIIVVLTQQHFNIIMITDQLAYPVVFNFQNIVIVLATIYTLGFLSSYIASSRVSKKLLQ